ncbi:MAG: glycosyltransferase [Candidatus Omnitrophica bacterium]|nr:glycosyltransferase [Candidatus Omnitrophota bacterium]
MNETSPKPKVSVKVVTYNHEAYIAKAIESVLMQKVNFDYEIVIGEDCSTDNTRQIVVDYQRRYPQKIRLLLHEKNMGSRYNNREVHKACRGEYVAILDGDDYWTSPDKLQKQVDFLDSHPGYSACFHNAQRIYENGRENCLYVRKKIKTPFTLEDLLEGYPFPTCSSVYRNTRSGEFPPEFDKIPFGDWPLHVLNAESGDLYYIDEVMSVYRVHEGGMWSVGGKHCYDLFIKQARWNIIFYEAVNKHLGYKYDKLIKGRIRAQRRNIRHHYLEKYKSAVVSLFPRAYAFYRRLKYGNECGCIEGPKA